jgi:hypothetical protein
MKTYEGVEVPLHVFLTLTLDGGELSASRLYRLKPTKETTASTGQEPRWVPEAI